MPECNYYKDLGELFSDLAIEKQERIMAEELYKNVRFIDCLYPDWEGGLLREKHTIGSFDKNGFCSVCGMKIDQATCGRIKI